MPKAKASLLMVLTTAMTVAVLLWIPATPRVVVHTLHAQPGEVIRSALFSGVVGYASQQPCVSLQDGFLAKVCVEAGDRVRAGDLLFCLDTSMQEAALERLYSAQYEQRQAWQGVALGQAYQALSWEQQEAELLLAIAGASVRAQMDGVMEAVYVQPGGYVQAASLLGQLRGEERCVMAAGPVNDVQGLREGMAAEIRRNGTSLGAARLQSIAAPQTEGTQQLAFAPLSQDQLAGRSIGERVTVHAILETITGCVPIPLSAVDSQNRIWYVQDGRARQETMEDLPRSAEAVAAPMEWAGRQVILLPDEDRLYDGCAVKEAKRR